MTDVLLIQPPIRDFYLTVKRTVPYGLASIAAALIQEGFSVDILDALATKKSHPIELPEELTYLDSYYGKPDISPFSLFHRFKHYGYSFEHLGKRAKSSGAFLVGISALFTPYINEALKTAETVKSALPDCIIVLGGHHPTLEPESVMQCRAIDIVLRGEGEVNMPILASAIKRGDVIDSVPGIVFRKPDGSIKSADPSAMEDINRYPLPAIHLLQHDFYRRRKKGSMVVVTSRGCPLNCSYCAVNTASHIPYRRRSVSSVIKEMENAVFKYNAGFIDFEDENLSMNRWWFLDLLKRIGLRFKGRNLELRAMNGLYPNTIDDEVVYEMKRAGFKTLNLSLGSTSSEQLKRFHRLDVREAFDNALHDAEAHDLDVVGYVIAAAPFQTASDTVDDLVFLAERRVLAGVSIFYPAPGSEDYRLCKRLGILPHGFDLMRASALPVYHTTSRREAATLLRLGRLINFAKSLIDSGYQLPEPKTFRDISIQPEMDRNTIGYRLLQGFMHDGKIRGMTPGGEIYEHSVSEKLSFLFIEGLKNIRIRGYKSKLNAEGLKLKD